MKDGEQKNITNTSRKSVTIWERFNPKTKKYEFNHIEYEHVLGNTPVAKSDEQEKSWHKTKWKKEYGYLDDFNNVIK